MNVYDFDGTVYDGDSSKDFFLFSLRSGKIGLFKFIKILIYTFLYFIKIISVEKYKEIFFNYVKNIDNLTDFINKFWEKYDYKINNDLKHILNNNRNNYIITASPEFLIKPISKKYNAKCIGTKIDVKTGIIDGKNCSGYEKVMRLNEVCPNAKIDSFYTDSIKDKPLVNISKKSYMVIKRNITPYDEKILKK